MGTSTDSSGPEIRTISASDFKARCLKLMDEVAAGDLEVIVTKNGHPVSRLVRCQDVSTSMFGIDRGQGRPPDTQTLRPTRRGPSPPPMAQREVSTPRHWRFVLPARALAPCRAHGVVWAVDRVAAVPAPCPPGQPRPGRCPQTGAGDGLWEMAYGV